MDRLIKAVLVVILGGIASFLFGQSLPRRWFSPYAFIYRAHSWEDGGRLYQKIGVHRWKDRMPDMSRIVPGVFKKKAQLARTPETMYRLIQETCVAEFIHWLLVIFVTPPVFAVIGGTGGALAALANMLGNLVFIIIQRYNRPRLMELHTKMEMRRSKCSS